MEYREIYEQWLANPYFDEAIKEELKGISEDENEIKERFLYGSGIWYRRSAWNHRCRNQPHETSM